MPQSPDYIAGYKAGIKDAHAWIWCANPPEESDGNGYSKPCILKLDYGGPVVAVYHEKHGWLGCGNAPIINGQQYRFIEE